MKYVSIDIETTGLDINDCDIIEFGAVLDDLSNPLPLEDLPTFHTYFHKDKFVGEPFALSMHKEIFLRISEKREGFTYISPEKFGNKFKNFLAANGYILEKDRVVINVAGKNFGTFDYQFLKNKTDLFKHVKISSRIMDPAILYLQPGDERLPGLETCLSRAGFQKTVSHCALDDAFDVVRLLRAKFS